MRPLGLVRQWFDDTRVGKTEMVHWVVRMHIAFHIWISYCSYEGESMSTWFSWDLPLFASAYMIFLGWPHVLWSLLCSYFCHLCLIFAIFFDIQVAQLPTHCIELVNYNRKHDMPFKIFTYFPPLCIKLHEFTSKCVYKISNILYVRPKDTPLLQHSLYLCLIARWGGFPIAFCSCHIKQVQLPLHQRIQMQLGTSGCAHLV